jgi:hypothetical protein
LARGESVSDQLLGCVSEQLIGLLKEKAHGMKLKKLRRDRGDRDGSACVQSVENVLLI